MISYGLPLVLQDASVGSSHNRPTPAEDNEEALLLANPAIGLLDKAEFRIRQQKKQEPYIPGSDSASSPR